MSIREWAADYAEAYKKRQDIHDAIPTEIVQTHRGPVVMRRFDEVRDRNWYEANKVVRDLLDELAGESAFVVVLPNGQRNLIDCDMSGQMYETPNIQFIDLCSGQENK